MVNKLEKILYTAHIHTTGGREGKSSTSDGVLSINLTPPKEMGGSGVATNPEQLFAMGYSACFMGAMKHVAASKKIKIPDDASIDASVSIGPIPQGFGIAVKMDIALPNMDRTLAQEIIDEAHQVCPYSNATRGNIEVNLSLL